MTYTKPHNVSYTDMAIWIDENSYNENCDDTILYEYLYHLVNMLAHEGKYFNRTSYYDEFAIFSASRLFLRIRNPKQNELTSEGTTKLKQIRSILNYIKTIIYPYKVDFEQEYYTTNECDTFTLCTDTFNLASYLSDEADTFSQFEFELSLQSIIQVIRNFISRIPYDRNSPEFLNIYTSCLLTLLDSVTFDNVTIDRIQNLKSVSSNILQHITNNARSKTPILYHLDKSYTNYIKILVNEIRHVLSKELSFELHSKVSSDSVLKSLIANSLDRDDV